MGQAVILSDVVIEKLDKLEKVLFSKGNHGFRDTSKEYVDKIFDTIYSIPKLQHRETKTPKYGRWFVTHHVANKRTQYKITFDKKDNHYIVRNIITSSERAYKLIMGLV